METNLFSMKEISNIPKRLPKVVSSTTFVIGLHPGGYVLRDANGHECSPVLSSAALLCRWCLHNGYKHKRKNNGMLLFIKDKKA